MWIESALLQSPEKSKEFITSTKRRRQLGLFMYSWSAKGVLVQVSREKVAGNRGRLDSFSKRGDIFVNGFCPAFLLKTHILNEKVEIVSARGRLGFLEFRVRLLRSFLLSKLLYKS